MCNGKIITYEAVKFETCSLKIIRIIKHVQMFPFCIPHMQSRTDLAAVCVFFHYTHTVVVLWMLLTIADKKINNC